MSKSSKLDVMLYILGIVVDFALTIGGIFCLYFTFNNYQLKVPQLIIFSLLISAFGLVSVGYDIKELFE